MQDSLWMFWALPLWSSLFSKLLDTQLTYGCQAWDLEALAFSLACSRRLLVCQIVLHVSQNSAWIRSLLSRRSPQFDDEASGQSLQNCTIIRCMPHRLLIVMWPWWFLVQCKALSRREEDLHQKRWMWKGPEGSFLVLVAQMCSIGLAGASHVVDISGMSSRNCSMPPMQLWSQQLWS